jgi:hypothetical protein
MKEGRDIKHRKNRKKGEEWEVLATNHSTRRFTVPDFP